jgi:t-SNARE complex subunit (syntaxin)
VSQRQQQLLAIAAPALTLTEIEGIIDRGQVHDVVSQILVTDNLCTVVTQLEKRHLAIEHLEHLE